MCGITALYNRSQRSAATLAEANRIVAHRGPDDEGFLLWRPGAPWRLYVGIDSFARVEQCMEAVWVSSPVQFQWHVHLRAT